MLKTEKLKTEMEAGSGEKLKAEILKAERGAENGAAAAVPEVLAFIHEGLAKLEERLRLAKEGPGLAQEGFPKVEWKPKYMLRRERLGWRVVFDGREGFLPDEKGVGYIAWLLRHGGEEPIHASDLARAVYGESVVEGQRNLAVDDRETLRSMALVRRKCEAVIEDEGASELEREEARMELETVNAWARRHLRGTEASEQRQVRAVRQAIRRVLEKLKSSEDEVLRRFGEHLERHLWEPSGRGSRGWKSRVRAGLAGRFTYEAPAGVRWLEGNVTRET